MENELVSVIIPTYGRPEKLPRAIESVLQQNYLNFELIVVDDNDPGSESRRETQTVMRAYQNNNKIKYITHIKNKHVSAARNTGFKNSKGQFIMFLDDDDEFLPDKMLSQVRRLSELDATWGCCYSNYIRQRNGKTISYSGERREGKLFIEGLMRNLFIHPGSNLLVRRNVVEELDGFDERFVRNEDIEFLCRILMKYKIAYTDTIGLIVHVHDRSDSKNKFEEINADYVKKLSPLIDSLPFREKERVKKMIYLQLFRFYITVGRNYKKALNLLLGRKLSVLLVIKYGVHLVCRKIKKKAYGFRL